MKQITFLLSFPFLALAQNHSSHVTLPFDYKQDSLRGPPYWRYLNTSGNEWEQYRGHDHIDLDVPKNECKSKRRPSPINLVANVECHDSHEILTRQINSNDCKMDTLTFSLTPHTLRADFPFDDAYCRRPTVDLPNGYPFRWHAHHIEVHLRAEHVLDGRRYDGEMQMYHLGQEDQKRELTAISVLFDASSFHDEPKLQTYIDHWEAIARETDEACDGRRNTRHRKLRNGNIGERTHVDNDEFYLLGSDQYVPEFDNSNGTTTDAHTRRALDDPEHRFLQDTKEAYAPRRKMFPYDIWPTIHYYRYKGMITMPPCSEIVAWRVLDEPLKISRRQLQAMARLLADYRDPDTCSQGATQTSNTGENVRPLQEINHERQELSHCTEKDFTFRFYPLSKT